jgi:type I restriction enzyme S subunit
VASRLSAYQLYLAANGVTRFGLTYQGTKNLRIALPPVPEQQQIAAFLDWKTGQIDALMGKKKELLEMLKEKRVAVITQAVTQGLDPAALLRDSGIPWLGKVPQHWQVKRGRFVMLVNPPAPRLRYLNPEEEVSFIPMEAVGVLGGLNLEQTRVIEDVTGGYTEFQDGDVIVAKITPCFENGKAALASGLANGAAYGTTELHVLRANINLDRRFLFYVAISDIFLKLGESEMYGAGGQKRVPPEFPKDFRMTVPPLAEQEAIADYLDAEMARLDALVSKVKDVVERLQEYRTALITAATTGKIDVRKVKIPNHGV